MISLDYTPDFKLSGYDFKSELTLTEKFRIPYFEYCSKLTMHNKIPNHWLISNLRSDQKLGIARKLKQIMHIKQLQFSQYFALGITFEI